MARQATSTNKTPKEIIELDLDQLYEFVQVVNKIEADRDALIDYAVCKAGLSAKYAALLNNLSSKLALKQAAENRVKASVNLLGETVKGEHLQAVFSDGRVTWDTKEMDGYAAAHPEIKQFRNVGKPSVAIREVKSHNDEE